MHLDYQWVPGSAIRSGGGVVGFHAEIGLVPAGRLGGLELGRHCRIALAADGNVVPQHSLEIRRIDIFPPAHVGGLAPRVRSAEPWVFESGRA